MRRTAIALGLLVSIAACSASPGEPQPVAGPHAEAVRHALDQSEDKELVYVVEPRPAVWDQWCGVEADLAPCRALEAMTIDLAAPFPADVAEQIVGAIAPARVDFVTDRSEVVLPLAVVPPEIKDDAGLLSFGRAITVDGNVYIPVDAIGRGWLFELIPTDHGWELDVLATWMA